MKKRYFTVQEARQLLSSIKALMEEVIAVSQRMEEDREDLQILAQKASQNSGSPQGTAFVTRLIALASHLKAIEETGCLVKSVKDGLVDFPHLRNGREVCLCWKYGEKDIEYWHEVDAGFAGRTPLLE